MSSTSASGSSPAHEQVETEQQQQQQQQPHQRWDYGGNPLAHQWSHASDALGPDAAFFQPGLFRSVEDKGKQRGNPVPLGLGGFALTTFVLSMINLEVRGVSVPNVVVAPALAYGGLVQLLAGMWLVAEGNTFGAWALSSYGGFWIGLGIIFTPGGFEITEGYGGQSGDFYTALAFYLLGWFIFTVLVWLATLRATLMLTTLLFSVWLTFLLLAVAYLDNSGGAMAQPNKTLARAGGGTGIVAAFVAWWIMAAGLLTKSNSFFVVPEFEFPWSPETRVKKGKPEAIGRLAKAEKERFSAQERDADVEKQD